MPEDDASQSGAMSQEDIDAALNDAGASPATNNESAGAGDSAPPAGEGATAADPVEASSGFSQADVDAALAAAESAADGRQSPPDDAPAAAEEALEGEVSPDDIDAALAAAASVAAGEETAAESAAPQTQPATAADDVAADSPAEGSSMDATAAIAGSRSLELPDFGSVPSEEIADSGVELLYDVDLHVKIELGRADMAIQDVLRLGAGSIVELDKLAGDPVDVLVNDRLVARGEVLILNDNFCVRISEITADIESEEQVQV